MALLNVVPLHMLKCHYSVTIILYAHIQIPCSSSSASESSDCSAPEDSDVTIVSSDSEDSDVVITRVDPGMSSRYAYYFAPIPPPPFSMP